MKVLSLSLPPSHTPLLLNYILQPGHHLIWGEGAEAKPGASGLQSRDDLWQVVADQTEPSVFCKLLNDWNAKKGLQKKCYNTDTVLILYNNFFRVYFYKDYVDLLPEGKKLLLRNNTGKTAQHIGVKESFNAQASSQLTVWLLTEPCGSQWAVPWRTDGLTSPQCILGILGHGISLIQYDQLEALPGGQEDSSFKGFLL